MTIFFYIALFVFSYGRISIAIPLDENDLPIAETDELAQKLGAEFFRPNFSLLLDDFQSQLVPINSNVHGKIYEIHDHYARRLIEIGENAKILNANLSDCLKSRNIPEAEDLYSFYENDCEKTVTDIGKNLVSIGSNKQNVVFQNKYNALMTDYRGCLSAMEPTPRICAGIVASTYGEFLRLLPEAKTYKFDIEKALKLQVINLSECAKGKLADFTKIIHNEFDKSSNCILSKVIIAEK